MNAVNADAAVTVSTETNDGLLDGGYVGFGFLAQNVLDIAVRIVGRAGVADMVDRFREEDGLSGHGGRPLAVSPSTAITLMLSLSVEGIPTAHVTDAADLILHRLTDQQCESLNLVPPTRFDRRSPSAHKRWRDRVHASLDSIFRLLDPYWNTNRRKRWLKTDWDAQVKARDAQVVEIKMNRLYQFTNAVLRASTFELPEKYRSRFTGHRAVDGTSWRTVARGTGLSSPYRSIEPNAWYYSREAGHFVPSEHLIRLMAGQRKANKREGFHGYEESLFVWTRPFTGAAEDYPCIADAIGHNPPGTDPASVVTRAARTLFEAGAPIGPLRGDKQYWAGQNIEKFHKPMWAMGYTAVTDYKEDDLGEQGQQHGAVLIDGDRYCPSILQSPRLVSASKDYNSKRIDRAQLRERIAAREPYLLKNKHKVRPGEKRVMICPAVRGSLSCSLWPDHGDKHPLALPIHPTASAGDVCDNKYSTSFEEPSKWEQEHRWGTDAWFDAMGQRSQVESYHQELKNTPVGHRNGIRLRGFAATFLLATLACVAVNIQRINAFLARKRSEDENRATRRRSKPRPANPYRGAQRADEQTNRMTETATESEPPRPSRPGRRRRQRE